MRAVLIAAGRGPGLMPVSNRCPPVLLPLIDRPFLQHVIEYLVHQGVTQFDLVLSHLPHAIETHLGDGKRWGCQCTYHLARDPERPYGILRVLDLAQRGAEPVLLGHADRLPPLTLAGAAPSLPLRVSWREPAPDGAGALRWTGWALLAAEQLAAIPGDADEAALEDWLQNSAGLATIEVGRPLSTASFRDILDAHRAVLAKEFTGLLLGGREVEPGVWLSRNVVLHPTADIVPPVFIGENCQIDDGVQVGPNVVVGKDCVLDRGCTVANSALFPGSYLGEGLHLADVLVDRNRLINARLGGVVTITDDFILASMSERHLSRSLRRLIGRLIALAALLPAAPLLLLTALWLKIVRKGPVVHCQEVVRLPAAPDEEPRWRTFMLWSFRPVKEEGKGHHAGGLRDFFLRFLPALTAIARGRLSFAGVPPRTREEIRALPHDWQTLYLHSKAGAVTEASVRYGPGASDEELFTAEAFYVATECWSYDLKLVASYLSRAFLGFLWPSREELIESPLEAGSDLMDEPEAPDTRAPEARG